MLPRWKKFLGTLGDGDSKKKNIYFSERGHNFLTALFCFPGLRIFRTLNKPYAPWVAPWLCLQFSPLNVGVRPTTSALFRTVFKSTKALLITELSHFSWFLRVLKKKKKKKKKKKIPQWKASFPNGTKPKTKFSPLLAWKTKKSR